MSMDEKTWDRVMAQARREARINGERRQVRAVRTWGPRGEERWIYVAQCGSECRICNSRREAAAR